VSSNNGQSVAYQKCINPDCGATYDALDVIFNCRKCQSLLDVRYDWSRVQVPTRLDWFEKRWANRRNPVDFSGVWRFRELMPFATDSEIVTIGEGQTILQKADLLGRQIGMKPGNLFLQYEGLNPSGSFKDNGMTAAFTLARKIGRKRVACASTGNTSASLALYASLTVCPDGSPMQAVVFVGSGKIAYGKLSQALDYGALTLQIEGDFDACLRRVREVAEPLSIYLMNSVNPFRLEGQKAIMYRILEARGWQVPDWVVVPGGNLGNCSAFGKAFMELKELGLINKVPRLAVINAAGANTLYEIYTKNGCRWNGGCFDRKAVAAYLKDLDDRDYKPHTVASAIEISRPVNLPKALRALEVMNDGVVRQVTDEVILEHRAMVAKNGFGCEPASAASVAGLHQLLEEQVISPDETVVCILTGHELKDPDATVKYHTGIDMKAAVVPAAKPLHGKFANKPIRVPDDVVAIVNALGEDISNTPLAHLAGKR
jgi:threonine synthase